MEIPNEVLIHNEMLGVKGGRGTLLEISAHGYYEVNLKFGDNLHRVLLPVGHTVIIQADPEATPGLAIEVER
jgi:hypothetical protein